MTSKGAAGYQFHSDADYTCETCIFRKPMDGGKTGCAVMGPSEVVSPSEGGSTMYGHFDPSRPAALPWMPIFTKVEIAYSENRNGYGCRRCSHFEPGKNDCDEVARNSAGDTPGQIHPYACCNVWAPDPERGQMTNAELVQLLQPSKRLVLRSR